MVMTIDEANTALATAKTVREQLAACQALQQAAATEAHRLASSIAANPHEALAIHHDQRELARRARRERVTGRPWWDMPCRRGECPGFGALPGECCGQHPDAQTPDDD